MPFLVQISHLLQNERECCFTGHSHLMFQCLFTHTGCHSWLHNAQQSFDKFFSFYNSLFGYPMSTWKTGCVSVRSVSAGTQRSDRLWFHAAELSASAFCIHTNMCFHLGLPCPYVKGTIATRAVTGPISSILNVCVCVCVSLFSSGFVTRGEKSQCLVGSDWLAEAQETLRGLSFLSFSLMTFNEGTERKFSRMSQKASAVQMKSRDHNV